MQLGSVNAIEAYPLSLLSQGIAVDCACIQPENGRERNGVGTEQQCAGGQERQGDESGMIADEIGGGRITSRSF
jgi:hypothetical protein